MKKVFKPKNQNFQDFEREDLLLDWKALDYPPGIDQLPQFPSPSDIWISLFPLSKSLYRLTNDTPKAERPAILLLLPQSGIPSKWIPAYISLFPVWDFLQIPFSQKELVARLEVLAERVLKALTPESGLTKDPNFWAQVNWEYDPQTQHWTFSHFPGWLSLILHSSAPISLAEVKDLFQEKEVLNQLLDEANSTGTSRPSCHWLQLAPSILKAQVKVEMCKTEAGVSGTFSCFLETPPENSLETKLVQRIKLYEDHLNGFSYQCRIDKEWTMEYLSPGVTEATGYSPNDLLYNAVISYNQIIFSEDRQRVREKIMESVNQSAAYSMEYRILCANREIKWVWEKGKGCGRTKIREGIITDISKQRNPNEELIQTERKWKALIEKAPDGLVVLDRDFHFCFVSSTTRKLFGYLPDERIEIEPSDLTHPDDLPAVLNLLAEIMTHPDQTPVLSYRFMHKMGHYLWIESTFSNLLAEPGIEGLVINFREITERVSHTASLRESEERFELAMKASRDGLFDWDLLTNEIYYSPGYKSMLGYEMDELENSFSVWERLTNPEDVSRSWKMLSELIKGERDRFEMEFRMKHKQGHWVDILSRANVVLDANRQPVRVVGTHVNISERKKAESTLREQEALLFGILDNMTSGAGIYSVHGEGKKGADYQVRFFNKKGLEIEQLAMEDAIGKSLTDIRPAIDDFGIIPLFQRVWQTGEPDFLPATYYEDHKFQNFYENYVFKIPSGEIVSIYNDVTDRVLADNRIKVLHQELEERVADRTRELEETNLELKRMNKLFVGRELRMAELKERIRLLEEQLEVDPPKK